MYDVFILSIRRNMETLYLFVLIMIIKITKSQYIKQLNLTIGERCPESRLEREIRASFTLCSPVEHYHCLFNSDDQLVESCYEFKQVPKGYFPKFNSYATGNPIDYNECPFGRFQGWPIKSYEIKECISVKSTCSSEGQLVCDEGSTSTDRTCKCNYKEGYAMNGGICCSPSAISDCFCYKKMCGKAKMLDAAYNCVDGDVKDSSTESIGYLSTTAALEIDNRDIVLADSVWYLFLVGGLLVGFLAIGIVVKMFQLKYKKRINAVVVVLMTAVLLLCVVYGLHEKSGRVERNYTTLRQWGFTVLTVTTISSCLFSIYIVLSRSIIKKLTFYTEEYEMKIFQLLDAAKDGDVKMLETLREEELVDMDDVDYDQRSALHVAACEGQYEAVKYLIDNHLCNPLATDRWNNTALDGAMFHENDGVSTGRGKMYEKVISLLKSATNQQSDKNSTKGEDTNDAGGNTEDPNDKMLRPDFSSQRHEELKPHFREKKATALLNSTKKGHLRELKRLLKNNTVMGVSNSSGRTALHEATENGMEDVVDFLMDPCHISPFGWWSDKRPIDCIPDKNDKMKIKMKKYMDDFLKDEGESPQSNVARSLQIVRLLNAASRGDVRRLKTYKKSNYDMSLSDYDGRTALHIAVSDNQEHVVDFLLSDEQFRNEMKDKKDRWGYTPFMIAQEAGVSIIYYQFLKNYKDFLDTENDEYRTYQLISAGASGDVEQMKRLFKRGVDMNLRDYDGRTALHLAAAENRHKAVTYLVDIAKANPNIPDRDNRKPILEANTEEIKSVLQGALKSEKNLKVHNTLTEVMTLAAKGVLKSMALKNKRIYYFSMESCDYFKNTPLHVAASKAKLEDVEFLLEHYNSSPFVRNSFWKTPLDLVDDKIRFWQSKIVTSTIREQKRLAEKRKDDFQAISDLLNTKMKSAITADIQEDEHFEKYDPEARVFMFLNRAYRGDILAIRRFIKTDEKERETSRPNDTHLINKSDNDKRTALHLAVAEGHYDLVKYLLSQKGIDKERKDRWGNTPFMIAQESVGSKIYYQFFKNNKDILENDEYRTYQLISAGASGNVQQLERLFKRGVDMNLRNYDGRTALHLAAAENRSDAVTFLVDIAKANPNILDRDNRKPIMEANTEEIKSILQGEFRPAENLMEHNTLAEVMTLASKGVLKSTALENERIYYFSMDSCDYFKNTPLHVAASMARLEDVEFLLDHYKSSPSLRNSFGKTPLDLVEDKIRCSQRKNATNTIKEQKTLAVFQAISNSLRSAMKKEIQVDEHFKKYEPEARVFMFINRAYRGDILAIKRFIKIDGKERETSRPNDTPLINKSDNDKRTALHLAAAEGHCELVKYLLSQKGIEKKPEDRWKTTPLDEANEEIAQLF